MRIEALLALVLSSVLLLGGNCDECPRVELPVPMTELRARALAPEVVEGLGVSTTLVEGDCRRGPEDGPMEKASGCAESSPESLACFEGRRPLLVIVVPTGVSLPRSGACAGQYAVEALRPVSAAEGLSSSAGELVLSVSAGRYGLFASADRRCAVCGLSDGRSTCLVDVPQHGIAVRDLVVDQATH